MKTKQLTKKKSAVGVFASHDLAEAAVKELERSGYELKHISIVGRGYHTEEHPIGYYNVGDRVKTWGTRGAFWGGLWGLLVGSAFFWVPGIGPLFLAGPLVSAMVGAIEGAAVVGGLSALGAALYSIGIPKDAIVKYERALKADKFLVIATGDEKDVASAHQVLDQTETETLEAY